MIQHDIDSFPDSFTASIAKNLTKFFDLHITPFDNLSLGCFIKNIQQKIYSNEAEDQNVEYSSSNLLLLSSKISSNPNFILLCPALRLLKNIGKGVNGQLSAFPNLSIAIYDYNEEVNFYC